MIPLVDLHCHLLAGLDDGPRTADEALDMCRIAFEDGTHMAVALAHQNDHWPANTPDRIRGAARRLAGLLADAGIGLTVFPGAEVMASPSVERAWEAGHFLSVADRQQYLLIEMPDGVFVDLQDTAARLVARGIRPILAHPERHPELLHDGECLSELLRAGCLVQVSAKSVTDPADARDARALKSWFRRGIVHFIGSDGHSRSRRAPRMAEAYQRIVEWAGAAVASRVGSTNGLAVLQGLPLCIPTPKPDQRRWWSVMWG